MDDAYSGTAERQAVDERQCRYCGRWFDKRGLTGHEKGCEFKDWEGFWVDDDGYIRSDVELGSAFIEIE